MTRTRIGRWAAQVVTLVSMAAATLVGPAVVAPTYTSAAQAAVHHSCTISRCAAARTARTGWQQLGLPTGRNWYSWPAGRHNFAGGRFHNREGQLPAGPVYHEYDVYPRTRGAARDAYRIVVNRSTGAVWFSPDHYRSFYRL